MNFRYIYPVLLLMLFAFFVAGGNNIFGYRPVETVEEQVPEPENFQHNAETAAMNSPAINSACTYFPASLYAGTNAAKRLWYTLH